MRQATVWVPNWPIIAAEMAGIVSREIPVAVVERHRVASLNIWAWQQGARVDMSTRQLQSLVPQCQVIQRDGARELRFFDPVLRAISTRVARFSLVEPGVVIFSAAGPARTEGGEERLCENLVGDIVDAAGCEVRVGIAEGTLPSLWAARTSRIIAPGASEQALASQPISLFLLAATPATRPALRDCVELLHDLGITTIADAIGLGQRSLVTRFGNMGQYLWDLATARTLPAHKSTPGTRDISVVATFDPPLTHAEHAAFAARNLAGQLETKMRAGAAGSARLDIRANAAHGEVRTRSWHLELLTQEDVVDRVRWQISAWIAQPRENNESLAGSPGGDGDVEADAADVENRGGITQLELIARDITLVGNHPAPLWGARTASDAAAARGAHRLQSLLGEEYVRVPRRVGGRLPEEDIQEIPWGQAVDTSRAQLPWPGRLPEPAPVQLLRTPYPVTVLCACGQPLAIAATTALQCPGECWHPFPVTVCAALPAEHAAPGVGSAAVFGGATSATGSTRPPTASLHPLFGAEGFLRVLDYAGPWVSEQRWWARATRRAYIQAVTTAGSVLLYAEQECWYLAASYI
ncbi:DNA polymerase Y family protein [Actinotignum sp. GS-2025f]|uniref:DNA polymerase Y family protein n=1 Tax=unclassified Actinotignum TaxID=2632702 RepID=UPI002A7F0B91|nr:DNA polymerase Y family protein [Actinotignum sp. SLA_B059]MDY5126709.1 DNA polymerase Y family protein [Actinotignum sp. SLA_B059]